MSGGLGPWAMAVLVAGAAVTAVVLATGHPSRRARTRPGETDRAGGGQRRGRWRTDAGAGARRVDHEQGAVGELAERLAAQLRSGASLPESLVGATTTAEPLGADLAAMGTLLRRGEPVDDALTAFGVGGSAERALLVAALRMAARHGGRTADALDGVAGTVRDRTAVSAELAAQTSQARYSAWVLAALPPLFLALGSMVDPRLLGALASPGGVMALLGALAFELAGAAWIRRILSSGSRSIGHR